jgi:predicted transcriptional regulator
VRNLSKLELRVMEVLWLRGPLCIRKIHEAQKTLPALIKEREGP